MTCCELVMELASAAAWCMDHENYECVVGILHPLSVRIERVPGHFPD